MSHPVWVRGLKRYEGGIGLLRYVAPRVGAWIETEFECEKRSTDLVAPRVGAWIETMIMLLMMFIRLSRTPCGCVD